MRQFKWRKIWGRDENVVIFQDTERICKSDERLKKTIRNSTNWYLKQLKGHKHLIIGNHDKNTLECEDAAKYLESVDKMLFVPDGKNHMVLCHFPIADWNKARHGSWHIYGHIHGNRAEEYQFMKGRGRALNAAVCINNYTPASFDELVRNNELFQNQNPAGDVLFVAKNKMTGEEFVFSYKDLEGEYEIRLAKIIDRNLPQRDDLYLTRHE